MKRLQADFYDRPVVQVARALIGCMLSYGGAAGTIVETEAYHESEPACHAHRGLTPRTEVMFGEPGHAYVYRSYGIHALLNAVCEPPGVGAAVLIRALAPAAGVELMRSRRRVPDEHLCSGPGRLTQALGVGLDLNRSSLLTGPIEVYERNPGRSALAIVAAPRIGITKAAELPWRFCLAGEGNVSRPWPWRD